MINELLLKHIPSKYYVDYLIKEDISFTDFETACILYHCIDDVYVLNDALLQLASQSNDENLKKQINNKIENDNKLLASFKDNHNKDAVYVVSTDEDDYEYPYGYFFDYNDAYNVGIKSKEAFKIEKQRVHDNNYTKTISYGYPNPYLLKDSKIDINELDSYVDQLGVMWFKNDASLEYFYIKDKYDETKEDLEVLEEKYDNNNFTNAYIYLPYPFDIGDIVKDNKGKIGIIECSKKDYIEFNEKVRNGLYADSFDAGTTVCYLLDNGRFSHNHPLTIFLELYNLDDEDENKEVLLAASNLLKYQGGLDFFIYAYEEYQNKINKKGK